MEVCVASPLQICIKLALTGGIAEAHKAMIGASAGSSLYIHCSLLQSSTTKCFHDLRSALTVCLSFERQRRRPTGGIGALFLSVGLFSVFILQSTQKKKAM